MNNLSCQAKKDIYNYAVQGIGEKIVNLEKRDYQPILVVISKDLFSIIKYNIEELSLICNADNIKIFGIKMQIDSDLRGVQWKVLCKNTQELKI